MKQRRRLLAVGHSYVIGLNRRLAHEMARVGANDWEITCVAPESYHADLGLARFAPDPDEPCATVAVPAYVTRSPHLFAYGTSLRALLRRGWDAVYSWEEPYIVSGFQLAEWTPDAAVFAFLTLQNIRKRYPPPFSWFEARSLRRADGWFYCGHSIHAAQRDKPGYAERPSRFGPLGVDMQAFRPDAEARKRTRLALGWSADGPPVVGFVGRFVPEKGLAVLMEAFDELARRRADVRLTVAGTPAPEDWDPELLKAWARGHGDRVEVIDRYVPMADVAPTFARARVVATPYLTGYQSGVIHLAATMGLKPEEISRGRSLLKLPVPVQEALRAGMITESQAEIIAEIQDSNVQLEVVEMVYNAGAGMADEDLRGVVDRIIRKEPTFVTTDGSPHFHASHCPYAISIPDDRREKFYTRREAGRRGKVACMQCL